ncbi:hypothetical protein AMTRI_Chr02g255820 [Amborella trichopoda]
MGFEDELYQGKCIDSDFEGAIFMCNRWTMKECLKRNLFGLPAAYASFVSKIKVGMFLFLFEHEQRKMYGIFRASSDGAVDIVPHAFRSSGKQFSAQIRFQKLSPHLVLEEHEFRTAMSYYADKKFLLYLSEEQVKELIHLFYEKKADCLPMSDPKLRKNSFKETHPVKVRVSRKGRPAIAGSANEPCPLLSEDLELNDDEGNNTDAYDPNNPIIVSVSGGGRSVTARDVEDPNLQLPNYLGNVDLRNRFNESPVLVNACSERRFLTSSNVINSNLLQRQEIGLSNEPRNRSDGYESVLVSESRESRHLTAHCAEHLSTVQDGKEHYCLSHYPDSSRSYLFDPRYITQPFLQAEGSRLEHEYEVPFLPGEVPSTTQIDSTRRVTPVHGCIPDQLNPDYISQSTNSDMDHDSALAKEYQRTSWGVEIPGIGNVPYSCISTRDGDAFNSKPWGCDIPSTDDLHYSRVSSMDGDCFGYFPSKYGDGISTGRECMYGSCLIHGRAGHQCFGHHTLTGSLSHSLKAKTVDLNGSCVLGRSGECEVHVATCGATLESLQSDGYNELRHSHLEIPHLISDEEYFPLSISPSNRVRRESVFSRLSNAPPRHVRADTPDVDLSESELLEMIARRRVTRMRYCEKRNEKHPFLNLRVQLDDGYKTQSTNVGTDYEGETQWSNVGTDYGDEIQLVDDGIEFVMEEVQENIVKSYPNFKRRSKVQEKKKNGSNAFAEDQEAIEREIKGTTSKNKRRKLVRPFLGDIAQDLGNSNSFKCTVEEGSTEEKVDGMSLDIKVDSAIVSVSQGLVGSTADNMVEKLKQ